MYPTKSIGCSEKPRGRGRQTCWGTAQIGQWQRNRFLKRSLGGCPCFWCGDSAGGHFGLLDVRAILVSGLIWLYMEEDVTPPSRSLNCTNHFPGVGNKETIPRITYAVGTYVDNVDMTLMFTPDSFPHQEWCGVSCHAQPKPGPQPSCADQPFRGCLTRAFYPRLPWRHSHPHPA